MGTIALSLGLLFAVGSSKNVDAATWHMGTPTVLRGKYKSVARGKQHSYLTMFIHKNSTIFYTNWNQYGQHWTSPMMGMPFKNRYQKISKHSYKIKGIVKTGNDTLTMYVYHAKNKIKYTFTHSYKHSEWLYRYSLY